MDDPRRSDVLHAYPPQLAALVRKRWDETEPQGSPGLPALEALERLLSICYQASLLREEERPVTFRLILGGPDEFPPEGGPPAGLHRLVFTHARPFDPHELRRLSPAIKYHRALIGLQMNDRGGFGLSPLPAHPRRAGDRRLPGWLGPLRCLEGRGRDVLGSRGELIGPLARWTRIR